MDYIVEKFSSQIIGLVIAGLSLFVAFLVNAAINSEKGKSYVWSCYQSIIVMLGTVAIAVWAIKYITKEYYSGIGDYIWPILFTVLMFTIAWLNLKKYKIGAVLITVLTINPVTWYINYIYYKKRWDEMINITTAIKPNKRKNVLIKKVYQKFNPPEKFRGQWYNDNITIIISDSNIDIFRHKVGPIKIPRISKEDIQNNVYTIKYKDDVLLNDVYISFTYVNDRKLKFKVYREGELIEIEEDLFLENSSLLTNASTL